MHPFQYLKSLVNSATKDQAHTAVLLLTAAVLAGSVVATVVAMFLGKSIAGPLGILVGGLTTLCGVAVVKGGDTP